MLGEKLNHEKLASSHPNKLTSILKTTKYGMKINRLTDSVSQQTKRNEEKST